MTAERQEQTIVDRIRNKQDRISLRRRALKKKRLVLYIVLFILGTLIGGGMALRDMFLTNPVNRNVSTVISFTYDGITQNKMPNGIPFSIEGLASEKVVSRALQRLDLIDKYDAQSIVNSLSIRGVYPKDILERVNSYESVYDYEATGNVIPDNFYTTSM